MPIAINRDEMVADYNAKFSSMRILRTAAVEAGAKRIMAGMARYKAVEKLTGVPADFIGVLHYRESACDFSRNLCNGEPLNRVTRLVPVGAGPWRTWEESAVWALQHEGFIGDTDWSAGAKLFKGEKYNGEGYHNHGWPNPYLFSGTDLYTSGKYQEIFTHGRRVSVYNPVLVDQQVGIAPLLKRVDELSSASPAPVVIAHQDGKKSLHPVDRHAVVEHSRALKFSGWYQDFCHYLGLTWAALFATFQQVQPYLTDWRTLTVLGILGGGYIASQIGAFNLLRAAGQGRYTPSGFDINLWNSASSPPSGSEAPASGSPLPDQMQGPQPVEAPA